MSTDPTLDACPGCGERMLPVLEQPPDPPSGPPSAAPLLAEPPVRLRCRTCPPPGDVLG